ncbi:MAG: hypothetical protein AB3N63_06460 [Puniceicoccaceae bacterium]
MGLIPASICLADTVLIEETVFITNASSGTKRTVNVPENLKDVSSFLGIKATVSNTGSSYCRVEGWFGLEWMGITGAIHLEPGESKDLVIHFTRHTNSLGNVSQLFPGMAGIPGGTVIHWADYDLVNDSKSLQFAVYTGTTASVEISNISAYGDYRAPQEMAAIENFYPFVDVYGQYKHDDWPGKIHSDADFADAIVEEEADLNNHLAPANRNQYGGWATGPKFEATGRFRVQKIDGKWWFIDPAGCLFWSFSATGFGFQFAETLTEGRGNLFEDLPLNSDPEFGQFVNPHNDTFGGRTYQFGQSNLYRKFGSDWQDKSGDLSLRRIKSWGMNSMGCWSDSSLFNDAENPVPYTLFLGWNLPTISVSAVGGGTLSFPDPFAANFASTVYSRINGSRSQLNSEWCLGYFFQNEYRFRRNDSDSNFQVAHAYIQASTNSAAENTIIDFLQNRHSSIAALNSAWGTSYGSWSIVRTLSRIPVGGNADALAFEEHYASELYRIINEEGDKVSPDALFLGSRFIKFTPVHMMNAAAPYIDVIGINWYKYSPTDIHVAATDKPIIIGEFHFGAVERGYFDQGLKPVGDQQDRAEAMYYYLRDALLHDNIVGAHWFQYRAQAITGRKDGESYQIGLVDVADNPYPETRSAARQLGRQLYRIRGSQYLPADQDADGIPDDVETADALNINDPSDAQLDKDMDGKSNYEEFLLGTEISVPDAQLTPEVSVNGSQTQIRIPAVFLHEGRRYHVEQSNELISDWLRIESHVPSGPQLDAFVFDHVRESSRDFYRIRVELVD